MAATPGLHPQGSFEDRRSCHRYILDALVVEQARRPDSPDWVELERAAVADAAARWARSRSGLRVVTVDDVEAIEHRAMGHVDYSSKLALYVMELIYGR